MYKKVEEGWCSMRTKSNAPPVQGPAKREKFSV